jgi:hydroxymethylpyrimidine/phosphomethylpyrimidine kinase
MIFAASILINLGAKNVFMKGGHLDSEVVQDIFVNKKEIMLIKNRRIATSNTHGTGCTLSSAISTYFACGKTLKKSCELATKYVNNSIRSNLNYGKGHGPINHLSSITVNKKFR